MNIAFGQLSALPDKYVPGKIYFVEGEGAIYVAVSESEIVQYSAYKYLEKLSTIKQDVIEDLEIIRTGATQGASLAQDFYSVIGNKSDVGHNHDERYYTKSEVDEMLSNYVSLEVVQQMIDDAIANLNNPEEPETPVDPDPEPDTPVEPEVPTESIGSMTDDNSIVIDETRLENGTYTLRYIDANDNIIDNFNEITSFEINN